uniref:Putative secreted protein n=1 Tax=Anopheles darlingi TaxID=43151 RepID=A0A2M4DCY3_ANODA
MAICLLFCIMEQQHRVTVDVLLNLFFLLFRATHTRHANISQPILWNSRTQAHTHTLSLIKIGCNMQFWEGMFEPWSASFKSF